MTQISDQFEVLVGRQPVIDRGKLARQADVLTNFTRVLGHVDVINGCRAGVGFDECGQNIDRRGLARPVATEQSKDRPFFDPEAHFLQYVYLFKGFSEVIDLDGNHYLLSLHLLVRSFAKELAPPGSSLSADDRAELVLATVTTTALAGGWKRRRRPRCG